MAISTYNRPPLIVVIFWTLLIVSLVIFFWWAGAWGKLKAEREAKQVFGSTINVERHLIADCLADSIPLTGRRWQGDTVWYRWNEARHLKVELNLQGNRTRVAVFTPLGRPLRDQESKAISQCANRFEPVQ